MNKPLRFLASILSLMLLTSFQLLAVGFDLEVGISTTNPNPAIYTNVPVTVTATNTGDQPGTGIQIRLLVCGLDVGSFVQQAGLVYATTGTASFGTWDYINQRWDIPSLAPGQTATLNFTLFALTTQPRSISVFAQAANTPDVDSTPNAPTVVNNVWGCFDNQDDEAVLNLNGGTSPACAIAPTVSGITCNDNGTPNNPADDRFSFTVNATNAIASTGYQLFIPQTSQAFNGTYGSPLNLQNLPISAGNLTLNFTDNMTGNCSATATVAPPAPCSTGGQLPDLNGILHEDIPAENGCYTNPGQNYLVYSMQINNTGSVAAGAFKVKFYFSLDNSLSTNDVLWSTVNVASLGVLQPNGPVFISPNQPVPASLAPNVYYVIVVIDADSQVAESNEANNIIPPSPVNIGAPDLSLVSYSGLPSTVAAGSSFPVQVTLKYLSNGFPQPANFGFAAQIFLADVTPPVLVGSANYTVGDFAQSNSVTKTVNVNLPANTATGSRYFHITAEYNFCQNPTNHSQFQTVNVTAGSSGIDLELAMQQNTANPVIYSNYTTTLTLVNKGPQAATGVKVKWAKPAGVVYTGGNEFTASQGSFNPNGDQIWTVGSLPANGTATLTVRYFLLQNGAPITYAQVSAANETDVDSQPNNGTPPTPVQDDEANSGGSAPPVLTPDLRVSNLILNQTTVQQGQVLTYTFRAENLGNGGVPGDFTIKSYISTDNQLSSNDVQDGTILTGNYTAGTDIPNIPGASTIPSNLPPGAYFLLVKIDGDNIVTEILEGNNVVVMPFNVTSAPSGNCETPIGPGQFTCATQGSGGQVQVLLGQTSTSPYQYALYTLDADGNTLGIQPNVLVPDPVNFTVSSSVLRKYNSLSNTEVYNKPIPASLWNSYAFFGAAAEFGNGYILFAYKNQNLAQLDSLYAIRTDAALNPIAAKYLLPGNHISYTGVGSALQTGPNRLAFMYRYGAFFGNESIDLVVMDDNLNIKSNTQWLPSGVFSQGARLERSICDNGFVISNNITLGFCNHGACNVAAQYFGDFQNDQFVTFNSGSAGEQSTYGLGVRSGYWTVRTADNGTISASHTQSIPLFSFPLNDTITLTKTLNGVTLWTRKVVVPGAVNVKAIREMDGDVVFIKSNPTPNASSFVNEACLGGNTPPTPTGCAAITVTPSAGQITIAGATAPHVLIKVFRANWTVAFECLDNCANPLTISGLPAGVYHLQIKLLNAGWGEICYLQQDVNLNSFGGGNGSGIAKQEDRMRLSIDKCYPSPAAYQVFMDVFSPKAQHATLDFYDQQGRFVHSMQAELTAGVNTLEVLVYDWKSGSYNVIARGEETGLPAYGRFLKVWEE